MKCSKSRFRPLLEVLEGRLQPGSVITGYGYGWSVLTDRPANAASPGETWASFHA